tara:strand:+ start:953 stop:2356 length:1404 start_codon:yes stop_codon:yes gene_type:complete
LWKIKHLYLKGFLKKKMSRNKDIKIYNISNAFVRIEYNDKVLLCDPWLTNGIFDKAWMVYPPVYDVDKAINGVTHVFISHIHKDHCDFNLMRHFPKTTEFYIPDIFPNDKIKLQLNNLGFNNIHMLPINKDISIGGDMVFNVIPPMNMYGHETEEMVKANINGVPLDCGLLLTTEFHKICILADDSPYYFDHLTDLHEKLNKVDLLMLPYNGYAADFPLNFINFSKNQRSELSHQHSHERMVLQSKFIKKFKPKNLLLYSSDFALAGPAAKDFYTIHPQKWLDKSLATGLYESHTGIQSHYLHVGDEMLLNGSIQISRSNDLLPSLEDFADSIYSDIPNTRFLFKPIDNKKQLDDVISNASEHVFSKMEALDIKSKSSLLIEVTDIEKSYYIDFNEKKLLDKVKDSPLKLFIESNYLYALLNFHSHWNDAQISHNLLWCQEQKYDPTFDTIINFFHKKITSKPPTRI